MEGKVMRGSSVVGAATTDEMPAKREARRVAWSMVEERVCERC
jgi:hypothetical protein